MRMATCPRPDGSGDDLFFLFNDGHIRHFRMKGGWEDGQFEGYTDLPGGWTAIVHAKYWGDDVYVEGVAPDYRSWGVRWVKGGAGWEGPWVITG